MTALVQQDITDPDLRRRVIAVVEKALATADPRRIFTEEVEGQQRTWVPWTNKTSADTTAARWVSPERGDVFVLELTVAGDGDAGVHLDAAADEPKVSWWPGRDDADAAEFLAWFERLVDRTANEDWDAGFAADQMIANGEVTP